MRIDASFPALLALAAISLSPACGLAKPTHTLVHKTPALAPVPKHARHKGAPAETAEAAPHKRGARHHAAEQAAAKPTTRTKSRAAAKTTEAKAERRTTRHTAHPDPTEARVRHRASPVEAAASAPEDQAAATGKATSEDFLRAAERPAEVPQPVVVTGAPATEPEGKATPPSKPVPVVSVVRPTAEKPQLPSVEDAAATPEILPSLYNKRGRLVLPPPLKGSHEILVHQNVMADRDGLDRVQDDSDLALMRSRHLLVALPVSEGMQVDERLPLDRRYCRPWAAQFLQTLARAHYAHFHTPLQVNSAVRTVEFQQHLIHVNGNAAPAEGDTASPHLTGQAIDIAKHGLSMTEIAWMRGYLLPLVQEGKIDVEEEFQQSCFHISVYRKYQPVEREEASTHRAAALAAAIR